MQLWISLRIKCCKRLQECFDIMFCSVCMDNVFNRECPPSLVSLMWSDHQSHIICVFVFVYFLFVQMHTSLMWSDHQSNVTIGDHGDGGDCDKIIFNFHTCVHMKYF